MSEGAQGCMIIVAIVVVALLAIFGFFSKHIFGNKQIIDFNHQKFNSYACYYFGSLFFLWPKSSYGIL